MEAVTPGDWFYIAQSINPVGGLLVSVPWGIARMRYPLWLVLVSGPALAYVQVVVVDGLWSQLRRISRVRRLLEEKRSPRIERLLSSGGAFWTTFLATPLIGPWIVMAAMRYAQVPQRRVALPMLLSLLCITAVITFFSTHAVRLFF